MEDDQITQLSLAHLDGRLTDEEFAVLQQELDSSPAARRRYAELARLDACLRDVEGQGDTAGSKSFPHSANIRVSRFPRYVPAFLAVGLIGVVAVAVGLFFPQKPEQPSGKIPVAVPLNDERAIQATDPVDSIAVISAEAEAVWETEGHRRFATGTTLEPGTITLLSGLAQVDFFSGASLTIAGPAKLDLQSSKLAILHRGRVRANVPPAARGFEIRAADVRLEDLGTSFGVAVDDNGQSDVVVFDGEVRAVDQSGVTTSLFAGDSAHLADGATSRRADDIAGEFPDLATVVAKSGGRDESRYASWKAAAEEHRQDPRLIAYYDFENLTPASRRLPNRAATGGGSELDGGIVGARVTRGRWTGKKALDFRGEGDRVRFQIPGEFEAITLYAWVRIDALDRRLNSLFLTDYFDPGEIHWQLSVDGALHFSTSPAGVPEPHPGKKYATMDQIQAENRWYWSEEFWDASQSGKWFLLATTADRKNTQQVTHYINGQPVGFSGGINMQRKLPKMRIGGADLGNWTDPIRENAIRSLNGRIDEFAIYSSALSAEEIQQIYEQGRP